MVYLLKLFKTILMTLVFLIKAKQNRLVKVFKITFFAILSLKIQELP